MTDPRRHLPSVDALLGEASVQTLGRAHPRTVLVRAVRAAVDAARAAGGAAPADGWPAAVARQLDQLTAPGLVPLVNATGVVLHTNLGRSLLAPAAVRALHAVAESYSNLEYDLGRGSRGSRQAICRALLVELTGAEDALVVNNAAAGLLLALAALARDGDAIVSRGELVEIGGAFRVPDIMARSGARLVEVGTTNRTHREDYVRASSLRTRALLKVHRSNFRQSGFTAEVSAAELARLAHEGGAACLYDLGSGLLLDLSPWGLRGEPTVHEAVASGVDLTIFSGDKLLGGPQAGILVGTTPAIEACRTDPIARAVRADKYTLAALEATLALYREPETARREIPTLRMLTEDVVEIRRRGEAIVDDAKEKSVGGKDVGIKAYKEKSVGGRDVGIKAYADLVEGFSEVGGGSFPDAKLPTWLIQLTPERLTADGLAGRLREGDPPIITRIERDHVVLDPRTILPTQVPAVASALNRALGD